MSCTLISSLDEDILRYDTNLDSISVVISGQGTCDRFIHDMVIDESESLWLAHNNGVTKIDLSTNKVTCYNHEEGLPVTQINSLLSTDSILLLGTDEGLYKIELLAQPRHQSASININTLTVPYIREGAETYRIKNVKGYMQLSPLAIGYGTELSFEYTINQKEDISTTTDEQIPLDRLEYGRNQIGINLIDLHGQIIARKNVEVIMVQPIYKNPLLQLVVFITLFGILYTGKARAIVEKARLWIIQQLRRLHPLQLKLTFKLTDGTYTNILVNDIVYM